MGRRYNRIKRLVKEGSTPFTGDNSLLSWRKRILKEFGEWVPIDSAGPTNSSSTTFGYFIGGSPAVNYDTGEKITFTYNGLDGIENYPTSITIDQGSGEVHTTDPPPFSQVGVQGYTAKLNPRYKEAQEKYEAELKEWERKKEQQQKDIEATLKSFGTSWEAVRAGGGIVKVGNSYVALINTDPTDFGSDLNNNVRVVRMVPCDPSKPMTLQKPAMVNGVKVAWHLTNAQYSDDVYLQIGKQPKPPMEQEYLMPRRTDFKDVNPLLDLGQEYAERVGADYMMGARVGDAPEQPSFFDYDPSKMGGELAQVASTDPTNMKLSQQDLQWLNDKQRLVNMLKTMQNYGGPAVDFAQWAINWAKGDYTPIKKFSPQMRDDVLDQITKALANRPGTSGAVQYHDYGTFTNNSTRLGLGRFTFEITPNGVRVKDNFDVDRGGAPVGGALHLIPGLQDDANKITELGNKVGGGKGSIPIDVTIPWSQISPQLQNKLDPNQRIVPVKKKRKVNKRGRVVESTWDRVQKRRKTV